MIASDVISIVEKFARFCNISIPDYEIKYKAGEKYLCIIVGKINDVYASNLTKLNNELDSSNEFFNKIILKVKHPIKGWLNSLECQLLQKLLSQSLTIGKANLDSDFHQKVIPSVDGKERLITNKANHIIYGRRGAGKSSLLLHGCNRAKLDGDKFVWIALQQYSGRDDFQVIPQFLYELVENTLTNVSNNNLVDKCRQEIYKLEKIGAKLSQSDINRSIPVFSRYFLPLINNNKPFFLFIDDLHLLKHSFQPYFLSVMYSIARGNNIYLKITSIENLTKLYDNKNHIGLETPGDAQVIRLDYNLMNPGVALKHIEYILNSYVRYIGIPSVSSLISSKSVLDRLTWMSAGVPRDALYVFNNSISKALDLNRKEVTVTDINMAAADSLAEKERYIKEDFPDGRNDVRDAIKDIKEFCENDIKLNAFLVRIDPDNSQYKLIRKICDLRFIHILHPGITPDQAGKKYEAYLLDYALYTGFRMTRRIKEFDPKPKMLLAKELRKLGKYRYYDRLSVSSQGELF